MSDEALKQTLVVVKHPDHVEVQVAPHVINLVGQDYAAAFAQHLHAMMNGFMKQLEQHTVFLSKV